MLMVTNNAATNISARVLNLIILLRVDEHDMTIPADLQVLSPNVTRMHARACVKYQDFPIRSNPILSYSASCPDCC